MAYNLTLTYGERCAIDWIGNRYSHGDDLADLLTFSCDWKTQYEGDYEWTDILDITFIMPEHIAWQVSEIIDEDGLACFGSALVNKLLTFQESIV